MFVFEKKSLEKLGKKDRDKILDTLRRGVSQLTKLRHPNLLSVMHPLEDSRCIAVHVLPTTKLFCQTCLF